MGLLRSGTTAARRRTRLGLVLALTAGAVVPAVLSAPALGAGTPTRVTISPSTLYLQATGTTNATISATVYGSSGKLANQPVTWSTSGGATFSPQASVTGASGVATTKVTSSTTWGPQTITANAGTASGTSQLIEYRNPAHVTVQLQPALVPADGVATSQVT